MTIIGKLLAAGPPRMGPTARRTVAGTLVALVLIAAPGGVAAADPASDTQGQIDALQAQVSAGANRIHALTVTYQQANLQSSALGQQLATDTATLRAMQARLTSSQRALRGQALRSYTGQQPTSYGPLGGSADPAVRAEYLLVASGNVADSVDQLKVARNQVEVQAAAVAREQAQSSDALRAASAARSNALSLAASEQDNLTHLQGVLTQQLAARQAAETAAAAAAATAHNQAAAQAASVPAPRATTQGVPVNGGLVSAVQSVVGRSAPSASTAAPPAAAAPPPPSDGGGGGAGGNWARLRQCESGGNYQENTGNGFYGAYQFVPSTWTSLGYPGRPDQEPPAMQDAAAMKLQAADGWGQWPACSAALGL